MLLAADSEPSLDVKKKDKNKNKTRIAGIDQDELLDPSDLADPDSSFLHFKGIRIHHKIYNPHLHLHNQQHSPPSPFTQTSTKPLPFPIILLHGFGASLFSWDQAMKPLAHATASKVVAFDRPAFGLTSRSTMDHKDAAVPSLNPYSMAFSVFATLTFIDFLSADKAILIGHSAGSLVAVNTYFEAPDRVAALILIAPAIFGPRTPPKNTKKGKLEGESNSECNDNPTSKVQHNTFVMIGHILSKLAMYIARPIVGMVKGMVNMVSSLYKKVLTAFLRSTVAVMLVRMVIDKFGIAAIKNAWYDANQITDRVLDGYTKPLRTKGWDLALLEYTAAMLTESPSEPPLSKRLGQISCPVLIITGDSDRLVPSWNAERLSRAIPGSSLEVIKNCGHLPHEEKVEEFISVAQKFLQSVFGAREEQVLQTAS
ncbi:hypothetical protein AQUCO_01600438v1 [Aquilegia coerulea]|uniref:AB hydrolase-1 domain-containing protein n=1 Tax=Aquilegia coerulea TaxID=218851 RepID=A0A2G5DRM2_AQUCA|nr:hypothetical protein AQUCO_01600438v1 [Aquilegia coerulea]